MTGLQTRVERLEQTQQTPDPDRRDWTPTPEYAGAVFDILADVLSVADLQMLMEQRLADDDKYS